MIIPFLIIILPAISKIFERVIFDQLHEHFHTRELYYSSKYGFRVRETLIQEMDKSLTPINIYIDFSKAFDTIGHNILMDKLKNYGIKGTALILFKNNLSNRKQYVKFGNIKSKEAYSRASLLRAPLLRGFGYGPQFSAARGKCQMGLLKPT